jgi:heptosyltransferase-2
MKCVQRPHSPDPKSILIVLPTWVGDFVMATPTLRAVRNRFTDARITLLAERNLRGLIHGGRWMDECVEWPERQRRFPVKRPFRRVVRELRRRRFDWAVLLSNSFRAALTARLAGARRRIGYDRDGRGWLLTDRLPVKNRRGRRCGATFWTPSRSMDIPAPPGRFVPMPLVEYYADLAEAIGCGRPDHQLELVTTPDAEESIRKRLETLALVERQPLVVISPGAKYGASKCWMPERFAAVTDRLIDTQRAAVLVTCGPGEEPIARQIGSAMKRSAVVLADPILTLGELKSLICRADLLICNDAGPRHIAKAFDVPVLTIFGPTHPAWTDTDYPVERIVRIDVDCGPCQQRVCPLGHVKCMTGVTVDAVYEAAVALLASSSAATTDVSSHD